MGHYVKMNSNQVVLWKTTEVRLPTWFQEYDWEANFEVRSATLFSKDDQGLSVKTLNRIDVTIPSAERAILEYLYDVPKQEGFDEANYIMEGLSSLRPSVLQKLLEACSSVRVKRLFLYMAEHYNHAWFERLNPSAIDFGSGKREIVKGGKLNKKYKTVVPKLLREDQ